MHGLTHGRRQEVAAQIDRHRLSGFPAAAAAGHDTGDVHERHQHAAVDVVLPVAMAVESRHFEPDKAIAGFGNLVVQKFVIIVGIQIESAGH